MRKRRIGSVGPFWLLALGVFVGQPALAQQGGVEVFSAGTLGDDIWRGSLSYLYERRGHLYRGSEQTRDPQDRLLQKHLLVGGVDYGLLPELTLSLLVPVAHNTLKLRRPGTGTTQLRAYGLGDVVFLAKYRVYKVDWKQSSWNVSLVGGLEFPSGDPSERKDGVRLPRLLQVGSGSWNPVLSATTNVSLNRLRFDGHFGFKLNTKGRRDFDRGEDLWAEVDAAYRVLYTQYPGATVSIKLGARWSWQDRSREDGHTLPNTGFVLVVLRPGITVHPIPRMDINLTVDVPVYQHYRGRQLGRDVRGSLAFGVRF